MATKRTGVGRGRALAVQARGSSRWPFAAASHRGREHPAGTLHGVATEAVTLAIDGVIEVSDLAIAVDRFSKVLRALAEESGAGDRLGWVVSGLEFGSATLTASPEAHDAETARLIPGVVHEYLETARQVQQHPGADHRQAVRYVRDLVALTSRTATEVRFETAEDDVVFTGPAPADTSTPSPRAIGSVVGRVQTLQARGALRFTLYDLVHDKAISCFLRPGAEDLMRGAWGNVVEVTGLVTRDPLTDRPRSVRDVIDVRPVAVDHTPGAFTEAEGALTPVPGALSSEEIIRNLRDAG